MGMYKHLNIFQRELTGFLSQFTRQTSRSIVPDQIKSLRSMFLFKLSR